MVNFQAKNRIAFERKGFNMALPLLDACKKAFPSRYGILEGILAGAHSRW